MDNNSKISLNVHLQVPSTTSQDGSHTPNTPEILNTIVNMTAGPFAPDFFRSSNHHHQMAPPPSQSTYTSTSSSTSTIATATRAASAMAPPVTASQLSPIAEENPVYNIASVRIIYNQYAFFICMTELLRAEGYLVPPPSPLNLGFQKRGLKEKLTVYYYQLPQI